VFGDQGFQFGDHHLSASASDVGLHAGGVRGDLVFHHRHGVSRHLSAALTQWRGPVLEDLRQFPCTEALASWNRRAAAARVPSLPWCRNRPASTSSFGDAQLVSRGVFVQ
jgi:hypothetical protein